MLDDLYSTFLSVAEKLSFSKTAEELFLSPNAVKKRIESLENQLGLTLFTRSNKGVALTKAGISLYNDLTDIYEKLSIAVKKAKSIENGEIAPLHIGIMTTFSDVFLTSKWFDSHIEGNKPVHLIKFGTSLRDLDTMLDSLGKEIDVVIDLYQPEIAKNYRLNVEKISEFDIYLGNTKSYCSEDVIDRIKKESIVECLYPERSEIIDAVKKEILSINPYLSIEYINDYNIWTIQKVMEKQHSIITFENLKGIFPYFEFIKLPTERKISFGIYYREKNKIIKDFLDFVKSKNI